MEIPKFEYKLFGKQFNFFESKKRIKVAIAGIQGGKTFVGAVTSASLILQAQQEKKAGVGLICAPTYKILEQSTLQKFFEIAPFYKKYYRKGENTIDLGLIKIYIRSTEDPNKLEGMSVNLFAWLDEGGQMKRDAYINIQGRTSIAQAPILITTTPYALNWLYNDVYRPWQQGKNKDTVEIFEWTSVDNPYFPKEEFERVKKELDSRVFKRRYLARFEKMEGLVYEDFGSNHIIDPVIIPFKEVICGIDWGFNNPAAIAVIGIDKENTFYLIDEYYETNKTKAEIIERAKYFQSQHKIRLWYPDPEDSEALQQMKLAGLYPREVIKSKGSVLKGIDTVRDYIRRGQFKVFSTCGNTLEEFGLYHYPEEKEGQVEEEPIKEFNHLMDAIRYAIVSYRPKYETYRKPIEFIVKPRKQILDPNKAIAGSMY